MAITRITNTRKGTSAITYVLKPKTKGRERVRAISGSNVLLGPNGEYASKQMAETREAYNKNKDYVQAYRIIQSFGKDELDPDNPEDIEKCNALGLELAEEVYPEHEVLIVTHTDGKGGMLHNHLIVNAVSFINGKSLRGAKTNWGYVAEKSDEVLLRNGMEPIEKTVAKDNRTQAEIELANRGEYVWKDDIKSKILKSMENGNITSEEEYVEYMNEEYEVDVIYRGKKTLTFAFTDENDKSRRIRGRTLGSDYDREKLASVFKENQERIDELPEVEHVDEVATEQSMFNDLWDDFQDYSDDDFVL